MGEKDFLRRITSAFAGHGEPVAYGWRSSRTFIVTVVAIAMFSDTFLYSFIIPIFPDVLEGRLQLPPSQTQSIISILLAMNALVSILIAPAIGYLADKVSFKNGLLTLAWVVNIVGTAITAWSTTLFGLFLGRLIQTFAGSLIWIVGMAVLSSTVGPEHIAKALGFVIMFVSGGLLSGPAISGSLYEFCSYDLTWATSLVILAVGTIIQGLMIERPKESHKVSRDDEEENRAATPSTLPKTRRESDSEPDETSPLLPPSPPSSTTSTAYRSTSDSTDQHPLLEEADDPQQASHNLYWIMLRRKRVLTALTADILFAMIIASFEATIPLHIKEVFGWESLKAGLLFLLIQLPSLILLIPAGWLKDKVGMRYPISVGFLLLGPSLWLLGLPGKEGFEWANRGNAGQVIFIVSLVGIGVWRTLLLGFGGVEVMHAADKLEAERPGIFGPHGGYSRSFSMSNISWKLGMLVGPLLSAALTSEFGYYWMNSTYAVLCLGMGIVIFLALGKD